jgi:hypothetical protein
MFPTRRITTSGGDVFRDEFSLEFDGTNDHVLTDFKPDYIHTNATFAMWVKMNDLAGTQLMGCHSSKRWYFGFSSAKAFIGVANQNKNNITITPTPVAGEWLHYACTAINGTATVYINGVAMADTMSYTQSSGTNPVDGFTMAARNTSTLGNGEDIIIESYMNANISEVVQYNKGLSASEIKTLYNGREPYNHKEGVCSSNLQAWWRMGDGVFDGFPIVQDQTNTNIGSNLIDNPSFDTNTDDWVSYSGGSGDDNTLSRETSIVHSGSGSLKIVYAAGNDGYGARKSGSNNIIASANKLMIMEGYVYIPSGSYSGGNPILVDGGSFSGATTQIQVQADSSITNQWQYMRTVQTLSTDVNGSIFLHTTGADPSEGDILYWDDISVRILEGNAGEMRNMTASDFEGDTP